MSADWDDINEEDEVRRLLSRPIRDFETPGFESLRSRHVRVPRLATAFASAVLIVGLILVIPLLGGVPSRVADSPTPSVVAALTDPPPSALPIGSPADIRAENEVWAAVRGRIGSAPIAVPAWLPPELDRANVELRILRPASTPEYEVVYRLRDGAPQLTFRLGPVSTMRESGVGFCCVRNTRAVLEFASHLFTDPTKPGARRVQWEEQGHVLSISSENLTGEEMLRIAWALDMTGSPQPAAAGSKIGSCTAASPDQTITRLLALTGTGDRQAVLDCFAAAAIHTEGTGIANWADLPATREREVSRQSDIADRVWVSATWTFASDPGGAWSATSTRFFLLGLEDGLWRVYEVVSAPFSVP